jgi:hypothetical protein
MPKKALLHYRLAERTLSLACGAHKFSRNTHKLDDVTCKACLAAIEPKSESGFIGDGSHPVMDDFRMPS